VTKSLRRHWTGGAGAFILCLLVLAVAAPNASAWFPADERIVEGHWPYYPCRGFCFWVPDAYYYSCPSDSRMSPSWVSNTSSQDVRCLTEFTYTTYVRKRVKRKARVRSHGRWKRKYVWRTVLVRETHTRWE